MNLNMTYPWFLIENHDFIFGLIVGMSIPIWMFVALGFFEKNRKKNINIAKNCDCEQPCNPGICISRKSSTI